MSDVMMFLLGFASPFVISGIGFILLFIGYRMREMYIWVPYGCAVCGYHRDDEHRSWHPDVIFTGNSIERRFAWFRHRWSTSHRRNAKISRRRRSGGLITDIYRGKDATL